MEYLPFTISEHEKSETLTYEDIPIIILKIKYPQFSKKDCPAVKRLNKFYLHAVNEYTKTVKKKYMPTCISHYRNALENSREFYPFVFEMSYTAAENSAGCLSIYREISEKAKNFKSQIFRFSDVWDVSTLMPITLSDVTGEKNMSKLRKSIIQSIDFSVSDLQYVQFNGDIKKLLKKHFDANNFYIKNGRVIIFYPQGTISDTDFGIIEFIADNYLQNEAA